MDEYAEVCYECKGNGDDYYYKDGELVNACEECWVTEEREEKYE